MPQPAVLVLEGFNKMQMCMPECVDSNAGREIMIPFIRVGYQPWSAALLKTQADTCECIKKRLRYRRVHNGCSPVRKNSAKNFSLSIGVPGIVLRLFLPGQKTDPGAGKPEKCHAWRYTVLCLHQTGWPIFCRQIEKSTGLSAGENAVVFSMKTVIK